MDDENEIPARPPSHIVRGPSGRVKKWFMPVVTEKILDAVRSGATQALAAQYAGIHEKTLQQWLREGAEAPEGDPLHAFYLAFHQARGQKAKVTLERIEAIAESINSWQGLAWILEHSFPKDFGRGIFGGDPSEAPEIRHIIEIKRDDSDALPAPREGPGTTRYRLSGPDEAPDEGADQTADDFPTIQPSE